MSMGREYSVRPGCRGFGPTAGTTGGPATIEPMVDFTLTDENRLVQQSARAFAEAEILPVHP